MYRPLKAAVQHQKDIRGCADAQMYTYVAPKPGNKACKEADVIGLQVPESGEFSGKELRGSRQAVGFRPTQRAAGHDTLTHTESSIL